MWTVKARLKLMDIWILNSSVWGAERSIIARSWIRSASMPYETGESLFLGHLPAPVTMGKVKVLRAESWCFAPFWEDGEEQSRWFVRKGNREMPPRVLGGADVLPVVHSGQQIPSPFPSYLPPTLTVINHNRENISPLVCQVRSSFN